MDDFQPRRRDTIDLPIQTIRAGVMPRIGKREDAEPPAFVLWGDSHADALVPAFEEAAHRHGISGIALTRGATPPLVAIRYASNGEHPPNWQFRDAAVARIQQERPPCVVLAARWSGLLQGNLMLGDQVASTLGDREKLISLALQQTLSLIFEAGASHVWLLGEVPTQQFNVPKQLALRELFRGPPVVPLGRTAFEAETLPMTLILKQATNARVSFLDLAAVIEDVSRGSLVIGRAPLYSDDTHLSATAAAAIGPALDVIFAEPPARAAGIPP
jgi:hypothetical protein